MLAGVDALAAQVEQLAVGVVLEVTARGLHTDTGHTLRDWVAHYCPWASPALVSDMVTVAGALTGRAEHDPLRHALTGGGLPVRRAARVVRALTRVRPAVTDEAYAADVQALVELAQRREVTDTELRRVTDHLLAVALPEETEAKARAVHQLRGVNESSLADGSLTRFIITADPEGAAVLRAVMASPLAAPAPDGDGPDPRSPTQRRYDALITMIHRGVQGAASVPVTTKAKVIITIGYDVLTQQLTGLGHTLTGQHLTPGQVRKLACDADLIPAVLGTNSEPLDLGRATRLATPAQRTALTLRDHHCTYPGCSMPSTWCEAHHITPWHHGGHSNLGNYALLCPRHHTHVHNRNLTASITTTGVTWHTSPP